MEGRIMVIPDIHGRDFWKNAVMEYPDEDIVFLGDYVDPYPRDRISSAKALENLEEIIGFARSHPKCRLLLGNHDLHYLCDFGEACRLDYFLYPKIRKVFSDNMDIFGLAELRETRDGKKILFSHAPVLSYWIKMTGETENPESLTKRLNRVTEQITECPRAAEIYLGHISKRRGGWDPVGSPIWADLKEVKTGIIPTVDYSVFGHTQQLEDPVITEKWACLDCRKAFWLDEELTLSAVDY